MAWQLQEAKQKFSEMVRRALSEGPQFVTRHGDEVVVVLSAQMYRELSQPVPKRDFKSFLVEGPDFEPLALERDKTPARTTEL